MQEVTTSSYGKVIKCTIPYAIGNQSDDEKQLRDGFFLKQLVSKDKPGSQLGPFCVC